MFTKAMSVLSRRSAKPPTLVTFGDDGRAVVDVHLGGEAPHLREAASLTCGLDPDDVTPFWRRRPTRWGPPQQFQATQAFFAFACALGVLGALTDERIVSGLALTHTLTDPLPWSVATADAMPRILVTTELPQRVLVIRTMAIVSFGTGLMANAAPLLTHSVRSWCYECLIQKTTPARALDLAFALGVSAAVLTAHTGVRDAGTVAAAAACAWAFAACVLAAQHSLFYACMLSSYGARLKSRSEISVSLLAALAVGTAGCVPAVARAALSATAPSVSATAALLIAYVATALISAAHTCELLSDGATDAALGALALAIRVYTFGGGLRMGGDAAPPPPTAS
jgi:hypothetical protein